MLGELGLGWVLPLPAARPLTRHAGRLVVPPCRAAIPSINSVTVARGGDHRQHHYLDTVLATVGVVMPCGFVMPAAERRPGLNNGSVHRSCAAVGGRCVIGRYSARQMPARWSKRWQERWQLLHVNQSGISSGWPALSTHLRHLGFPISCNKADCAKERSSRSIHAPVPSLVDGIGTSARQT